MANLPATTRDRYSALSRPEPSDPVTAIQRKSDAISYEEVGAAWYFSARTAILLEQHLRHIGATREIPENDEARRLFYRDFLTQLVVNNRRFPDDLPINAVLHAFFQAVLNGSAPIQGHNLKTHMDAFGIWWPVAAPKVRAELEAATNPPPQLQAETPLTPEQELHRVREQMRIIDDLERIPDERNPKKTFTVNQGVGGFMANTRAKLQERERQLMREVG
jgi:hypothetical protein